MMKISGIFSRMMMVGLLLMACVSAYAQSSFNVSVNLVDDKTNEPVGYATVSLTLAGDEDAAKFVLTDADGSAKITKVKKGN